MSVVENNFLHGIIRYRQKTKPHSVTLGDKDWWVEEKVLY
jgi:hypothetical protein